MTGPRHIASDTSGLVYVTDPTNNRVLIFTDPNSSLTPPANAPAILPPGPVEFSPGSLRESLHGGDWGHQYRPGRLRAFPDYNTLASTTNPPAR